MQNPGRFNVNILISTQLAGDCRRDLEFAESMHASQVALDLGLIAKTLRLHDVTVLAVSWGASVGIALTAVSAPPWLSGLLFDSPSFVLSRSDSVASSVDVLRTRVVSEGLSRVSEWMTGQGKSVEEQQLFDVLIIEALDQPGLRDELIAAYRSDDFAIVRRRAGLVRAGSVPRASYIPFLCSEVVPQRVSGKKVLGAYEKLRANSQTCASTPVRRRGLGRPRPLTGAVRVRVVCSSSDSRAPVSGCLWLAKGYGTTVEIVPGTVHVLSAQ
jgi:pimeloyl-ACP methyl ester carboxylesterase